MAQDPDEVVPIADYKAEYGNPATNGTGHKCIQWQGELCVVIPAKRRWKVHRSQVMEAALSQTTDNGDFVLTANQLEEQLEIMGDSLLPFEATGMSLDALVGHKQSSSASNCDGPHGGGGLVASLGASASFGIGGFKFHEVSKVTDARAPVARRKSGGGAPSPSPKENTKAVAEAAKGDPAEGTGYPGRQRRRRLHKEGRPPRAGRDLPRPGDHRGIHERQAGLPEALWECQQGPPAVVREIAQGLPCITTSELEVQVAEVKVEVDFRCGGRGGSGRSRRGWRRRRRQRWRWRRYNRWRVKCIVVVVCSCSSQ